MSAVGSERGWRVQAASTTTARKLGVLFLQSQAFFGADSAVHAQLMRYLDRDQARVHCACTTDDAADRRMSAKRRIADIPDVAIRPTDFGPSLGTASSRRGRALRMARALARAPGFIGYARREGIDMIHATEKPRDAVTAVILARLAGARAVVQMHVGHDDWIGPRVLWALRHADAIVGVSEFVSRSVVQAGYPPERVFTVRNSLDLASGSWDRVRPRVAVRSALGLSPTAPVVCIASRLFRWKGHHDLVAALGAVHAQLADVQLLIVGEDDPRANPGGGSYRSELEASIKALGLERNVVFTGFRIDVADLIAASDVFCQPSAEEPFGMVYLEAMAVRKPVVAYASGGAPEVVADGETGLLVPRGDIAALARALLLVLRSPDLARRFGEAGRARVESVFNPQRSARELLGVYRSVAGIP